MLNSTSVGAWLEARAELAGEEGRRQEEWKGDERGGEEMRGEEGTGEERR